MARPARTIPCVQHWASSALGALLMLAAAAPAVRADPTLDRIFYDRQAFELGDEFAIVTVVRAQLGQEPDRSAQIERVVRSTWHRIQKRAQWLGVQDELDNSWTDRPVSPDKPAMLQSGIRAFDPTLVGLRAHLGIRPQALAKLAFDLRLAPDTFGPLSADEKKRVLIEQRQMAELGAVDPSLLDALHQGLMDGEPRTVLYDRIDKIHRRIVDRLDSSAIADDEMRRLRANVFDAGVYIAVAVMAGAQRLDVKLGKGHDSIDNLFEEARNYVRNATLTVGGVRIEGLNFPQPPPLTADESADTAQAVRFLLDIVGHDTGTQLDDVFGRPLSAVFEAAVRSQVSLFLYSDKEDDALNKSSREALWRAAVDAMLPAVLWQDMIEAMRLRLPYQQVKTEVTHFQERTRKYLRGS